MTYQEMVREGASDKERSGRFFTASSDELTISRQFIQQVALPYYYYGPAGVPILDWPIAAGETQCDWLPFVEKQLDAIASLPEGWDSYGAAAPNPTWINGARNLVECLSQAPGVPKPFVNPTRNGGVQFEWEAGERYFELEVVAERAATYYWRDHSKAEQQEGTIFEGDSLDTVVEYVRRVGT